MTNALQTLIDQAWEDLVLSSPLETLWLPDTYTKIFDRPSRFPADAVVIEHFQVRVGKASRLCPRGPASIQISPRGQASLPTLHLEQ